MALGTRRTRRKNGIQWKLHAPHWVDPFPWIQGTTPEKMIFAALVKRRIYFHFQELLTEAVPEARGLPVLDQHPYRADFILPFHKIVLDPWDDFHHSLPDQARADVEKLAIYQALGFRTYHVWASDLIRNGVEWWFAQIPEMPAGGKGGFKLYHTQDDSAGIVSANKARRSFKAPGLTRRTERDRRH